MKKKFVQKLVLFLAVTMCATFAFAQDKTLVGKVTTFDSIPLIGVDVLVKSTKLSFKTDSLGRFQVFCNPEDKLEISADGFYPQKVKVEKEIRLMLVNLKLKKGNDNIDLASRYVNVGYGYVHSKDLLYAVSSANTNDIDFTKYDSVLDAIQGQFPGVIVENGEVVIRGITTFYGSQGNGALIVIDGAITSTTDLENMSPFDVKSIDVLKDGSSSVYGSRGANGVVIVETKKGK